MRELGLSINWHSRPQDATHLSYGFISHNLTLTRFLVCAHLFAKKSAYSLDDVRISYGMEGAVITDAWLLFKKGGRKYPILLEIDRGSEYQHKFKKHVWSRIQFLESGEYQNVFASKGCAIAYATTGELSEYREARARAMRTWAMEILEEMNMEKWAQVLRFTSVVRRDMDAPPRRKAVAQT